MKLLNAAFALTLLVAGPLIAADDNPNPNPGGGGGDGATYTLLVSTIGAGHDATLSGTGTLLAELTRQDIGVVTPGDEDFDAIWFDPLLGDAIDAITVCNDGTYAKFPRFPNVFISVKAKNRRSGPHGGDDAGQRRLAAAERRLLLPHHRGADPTAFDVLAGQPVDVDAVEKADDGTIYLSLDNDVWIRGGAVLALDGDMLMIHAADLAYNEGQVIAATPDAGTIAVYDAACSR